MTKFCSVYALAEHIVVMFSPMRRHLTEPECLHQNTPAWLKHELDFDQILILAGAEGFDGQERRIATERL
jgi:methyl coenzyme M reductase subunit C